MQQRAYLRAIEIDIGDRQDTADELPDPDLRSAALNGDASGKDRDEGHGPLTDGTIGTAKMTVTEGCDFRTVEPDTTHTYILAMEVFHRTGIEYSGRRREAYHGIPTHPYPKKKM